MTIKIWKPTLYRYATPQIIINWLTNQRACKIRGYRTLRLRLERHGIERYGEEIIERSLIGGKPWPYERSQVQSTQAHKYIYCINGLFDKNNSIVPTFFAPNILYKETVWMCFRYKATSNLLWRVRKYPHKTDLYNNAEILILNCVCVL